MTSSVASRPGFLRWLVTAGDPATLVATFSTAAGSPVNLSGSTVAAACANWSTSHAGSATVGGASNNEVTVAFTDTITGQLTGGGWTWTLTVDGVTTLAGPLDVAQPGVAGVTGGDASAVVVVDDVNVAVTVVGGGGGGAVDSVNGQTGVVVLGAADVSADPAGTAAGLVDDLSGVTAPATARSNLGLGTAAVADTGTGAANVIVGSDARLTDARTPTAHTHSGADIVSATVATARLGSGTADATTFLRGDGTWAAPEVVHSQDFTQGFYVTGPGRSVASNVFHYLAVVGNQVWHPIWLAAGTYDRVAVCTTVAGTSTWRLGLDTATAGLRPGVNVLDAGVVDMSVTAGWLTLTVSFTVSVGGWFFARLKCETFTSAPTAYCADGVTAGENSFIPGWPTINPLYPLRQHCVLVATGAAAGPFGNPPAWGYQQSGARMYVRKAS